MIKKIVLVLGLVFAGALIERELAKPSAAAQVTLSPAGNPSPFPSGSGLPGTVLTCNDVMDRVPYFQTGTNVIWICSANTWTPVSGASLTGTTGSIGGSLLALNACASGTATVAGSLPGQTFSATRTDGSFIGGGFTLNATVITAGTVTVNVCASGVAGTPPAKTYNVKL